MTINHWLPHSLPDKLISDSYAVCYSTDYFETYDKVSHLGQSCLNHNQTKLA